MEFIIYTSLQTKRCFLKLILSKTRVPSLQKHSAMLSIWKHIRDLRQSNQLSLLKPFTASFHHDMKMLYKTGERMNVGI